MDNSAQHSEDSAPDQSDSGGDGAPREPGERFPPCGHACPRNHHRADDKYGKEADREPKDPGNS